MQVSKQIAISSQLARRLPVDTINIIKDFCFYDMRTGMIRLMVAESRMEICRIFKSVYCTSRNNPNEKFDNPDTDEHWVFSINNTEYVVPRIVNGTIIPDTIQLQAVNCCVCGNYSYYSRGATAQNMCRCVYEEED
jgi:hypothetical protein